MAYKILIVEDSKEIRDELKILLSGHGYITHEPNDFQTIPNDVKALSPDLILLDIGLPYQDGFRVCSEIRSFSSVPIIFVTSHSTDMDELSSITIGGDDFIAKPYNSAILLARISAVLKRTYADSHHTELPEYKGITLNIENNTVSYQGKVLEFTKNEFKILYYLFLHQNKIIPRADIIEYLWDNQAFVDDNTLSVNITRIRNKLESIGVSDLIQTKRGQGYLI